MKHIDFYFDFISPYAYLAFMQLPKALQGLSYRVNYKPILFAALLKHHGQLGPAEIPAKRVWTYRQVQWLAKEHKIAFALPAAHPFNPLQHLRLAIAAGHNGEVNRWACETIFNHVWQDGFDTSDPVRFAALQKLINPSRGLNDDVVKAKLRKNTEDAVALQLFGVPSLHVEGKVFWGFDSLQMLRAHLQGEVWFESEAWRNVEQLPGVQRPQLAASSCK